MKKRKIQEIKTRNKTNEKIKHEKNNIINKLRKLNRKERGRLHRASQQDN